MYHVAYKILSGSKINNREDIYKANIVYLVREFVQTIPDEGDGRYMVPDDVTLQGMRNCSRMIMEGEPLTAVNEAAIAFNYEAIEFYEHVMDRMLFIFRKKDNSIASHWGLYIFSPSSLSNVIIHAPHPIHDLFSDRMAAQAFQAGDAKALFVAGAHRYSSSEIIDGITHYPADVSRYSIRSTVFNEIHIESLEKLSPSAIVQFHGYESITAGDATESCNTEELNELQLCNIIVAAGLKKEVLNSTPHFLNLIKSVQEELRQETGYKKLDFPGEGAHTEFLPNKMAPCRLTGYGNQQKIAMNVSAPNLHFIHVEVKDSLRSFKTETRNDAWNMRTTSRLAITVIHAIHKYLGSGSGIHKSFPMLGFDRNEYPGRTPFEDVSTNFDNLNKWFDGVMATWFHSSPFGFIGYYLHSERFENDEDKKNIPISQRWTGRRRQLEMLGWDVKPIYFGHWYPTKTKVDLTEEEGSDGARHANQAVDLTFQEGFPLHTIVYLDVENTIESDEEVKERIPQTFLRQYVREWLEAFAMNEKGYIPGVYCSYLSANEIKKDAPAGTVFWVHNVACIDKGESPGCKIPVAPPAIERSKVPFATVWQYAKAPIDYEPDFTGCLPAGKELGNGYTIEAPKEHNADDKALTAATCWSPLFGTHVQWTAEVDLDVAIKSPDPTPPIVIKITQWMPIWMEVRYPSSDYPYHIIIFIRFGKGRVIIVQPPRPPRIGDIAITERFRLVGESLVTLVVAAMVRFTEQRFARPFSHLLLRIAGHKFLSAVSSRYSSRVLRNTNQRRGISQ